MTAGNPPAGILPVAPRTHETAPAGQPVLGQESRRWRATELAITLAILLLVVLAVADSIAAADWVEGMPDVRLTALLALAAAVGFSRPSVPWLPGLMAGLLLGAVVVVGQVLGMAQFDGQSWFWARFTDLGVRLDDWFTQAFNDGITTDNVPFVLFIVVAIWAATFPSVLLVLRRRNPWPLLILLGVILSINVSYLDSEQWDFHFAFFAAGATLLVMRTSLLRRMARWRIRGTPYPDYISVSFLAVTLIAVVGLMAVSRAAPRPDQAEPLAALWSGITAPFDDLSVDLERLFSGVDTPRGAAIHDFGSNLILQGEISPSRGIVARVDAPELGLLRGATYDRYTTRGWQQSAVISAEPPPGESFSGEAESAYTARREVNAAAALVGSPRVLFSFGIPTQISRAVTIDQTAPGFLRLDIANGGVGAPAELAAAARTIAEREAAGEAFSPESIPAGWAVVGSDLGPDGGLLTVNLLSLPPEPDVVRLRPEESVRTGFTYTVTGSVSAATVDELQSADEVSPFWAAQRYLQLPTDLDDASLDQLRTLAAQIVGGATNRYDIAAAIEGYLCCTAARDASGELLLDALGEPRALYPFTTTLDAPPPEADAVTWWLFDNVDKDGLAIGGYYDYHASAMAVLLRTQGIPARVSTGYVLTEENRNLPTETFIVRAQDAFSWVEVFFPEYGWVDFDPTPPVVTEDFEGIAGERIAEQRLRPFEPAPVPALPLPPEVSPITPPIDPLDLPDSADDPLAGASGAGGFDFKVWWLLVPLIAVAALAGMGGAGVAAWRFSLRGQAPVERIWTSTQRLSRWGGLRADPADTPQEYAEVLGRAVRNPAASRQLAAAYTRARFGTGEVSPPEVRAAEGAWRALRGRLIRRIFRLPVPAAPLALASLETGLETGAIVTPESSEGGES